MADPAAWAMKLARALSISFGAETTGAQMDETRKNIAHALEAVNDTYSPEREQQVKALVEAARALMADLYIDEHPEDFHPDWHRLNAALAPFAEDR